VEQAVTTAQGSTDITLLQSAFRILDQRFGGKARAAIGIALSVATFATMILQYSIDNLGILPHWQVLGGIAVQAQGALMFLGKFTKIGNSLVAPDAKVPPVNPPLEEAPLVVDAPVELEPVVVNLLAPLPRLLPPPPPHQVPVMLQAEPKPVDYALPVV